MRKSRPLLLLVAAAFAVSAHTAVAGAQVMRTPESKGYVTVNGVELYYEVHGDGPPLIMLHGGVTPSEMFGAPLAEMAKTHKVVALQTAIRHPQLVDKLIVISAAYRSDGYYPEVLEAFAQMPSAAPMIAADVSKSPLASLYPSVNWETVFRKTGELANRSYDWSASVADIKAPTLLLFADADAIRPEHIVEFYKLLGGGQRDAGLDGSLRSPNRLAIIPNTTHLTILGSATLTQFASAFLKSQ